MQVYNCYRYLQQQSIYPSFFLSFQLCLMGTLHTYLQERDGVNSFEVLDICQQLLSAMNHIHMQQIIHRDLKPANVSVFFFFCFFLFHSRRRSGSYYSNGCFAQYFFFVFRFSLVAINECELGISG
jgi:hypothetical protein